MSMYNFSSNNMISRVNGVLKFNYLYLMIALIIWRQSCVYRIILTDRLTISVDGLLNAPTTIVSNSTINSASWLFYIVPRYLKVSRIQIVTTTWPNLSCSPFRFLFPERCICSNTYFLSFNLKGLRSSCCKIEAHLQIKN